MTGTKAMIIITTIIRVMVEITMVTMETMVAMTTTTTTIRAGVVITKVMAAAMAIVVMEITIMEVRNATGKGSRKMVGPIMHSAVWYLRFSSSQSSCYCICLCPQILVFFYFL